MNLSTATPVEIDTVIADLSDKAYRQSEIIERKLVHLHYAVGDRQVSRTGWRLGTREVLEKANSLLADERPGFIKFHGSSNESVREDLAAIDAARAERQRLYDEINRHEDEYRRRPWNRFFKLRATNNAHIHRTQSCSSLHRSNLGDLGWHPELSGKSDADAVAELGPVMCTKCFPEAPVEWRQDPKDLVAPDPDACKGMGEDPVEGTVKRISNWSGVKYYGTCPSCGDVKLLKGGTKLPKHKVPKKK